MERTGDFHVRGRLFSEKGDHSGLHRRDFTSYFCENDSQCRLTEQMELAESQEKILQICSCEGTVHLESTELTEQGVRAEGILVTELLYITTDDQMPIGSAREIYPFEQLIEIPQQTARTERNKPEELRLWSGKINCRQSLIAGSASCPRSCSIRIMWK